MKFYQKQWFMWLLLILLPPVGIIFMWVTKKEFKVFKKTIFTVIFFIWFIILIGINNEDPETLSTQGSPDIQDETKTDEIIEKTPEEPIIESDVDIKSEIVKEDMPETITENEPEVKPEINVEAEPDTETTSITLGQKNALSKAKQYLDFSGFSYTGLIDQLEFEGFTVEESTYAVDNCGADWKQQAFLKAEQYLDLSSFSYSGLIQQLEFEGFTSEQATYAADNCGADWNEQAALKAEQYLDLSSFSKSGLIEQLEFEGFTSEQAEYGANAVGY